MLKSKFARPTSFTKATISFNQYYEAIMHYGYWYIRNKYLKGTWQLATVKTAWTCGHILDGRILPTDNPKIDFGPS